MLKTFRDMNKPGLLYIQDKAQNRQCAYEGITDKLRGYRDTNQRLIEDGLSTKTIGQSFEFGS